MEMNDTIGYLYLPEPPLLERKPDHCYNLAMIVDFHTHIFPPSVKAEREKFLKLDTTFAELYSSPKAIIATADELIASMDRDEVDVSVVLNGGWSTQELCVEINDYILESMERFPGRLTGFCGTSLESAETAVKEIERCARGGMKGVGELRPDSQLPRGLEADTIEPVIDVIRERNLILLLHTSEPAGHQYPGKGKATPDVIYSLITRFRDIRLVCAHWGGGLPFYALMPEVKDAMTNVYFDTAASPFLYTEKVYRQVIELAGVEKVLFGSDYPLLPRKRFYREIESAGLSPDEREMVLSGNASRLLGIGTG
ncbi:MAG TPA: amidohydrolase [Dehalococcoidia bacterium]|nr:amidohydrolase [Dehalococcoidia bacterium]